MNNESGILRINTNDVVNSVTSPIQNLKIFDLVSEESEVLNECLPLFDFENPPVNPSEFASTLVETCIANKGIGLSANQCGFNHRVFVMGTGENYVAFFNPYTVEMSEEECHLIEGCLSFPLLGFRITRPKSILVCYQDYLGNSHTTKLDGMSARCFLHELDHLNGISFMHRAKPMALKSGMDKRKKILSKMMGQYRMSMKK